ncbi:DUF4190 domain-containing protein [Tautonia plasticadhaerens]|uniref:DUF4190 domain-containing protein n=1 Tax=Tautonia plasticadhaerens TaxID=2527974 RepID=A0A518H6W0_9BACT|nr:DUF4190 domain-containing protein [Tautonia plasticadhaerens]QDV36629.1 hypothetical protein ElP_45570 [Tautonia plasticadhaerens]
MHPDWHDDSQAVHPDFEDIPARSKGEPESTERLAVVSLVAGIAGFFLPVVGPVTAIVSGHVARDEIRKSRGRLGGDALAKTGLILGYVWVGLSLLLIGVVATVTTSLARRAQTHAVGTPHGLGTPPRIQAVTPASAETPGFEFHTIEVPHFPEFEDVETLRLPSGVNVQRSGQSIRIDQDGRDTRTEVIAPPSPLAPPEAPEPDCR